MKLFIGCSCYDDISSKYMDDCKKLLDELFKNGHDLVFGACGKGIMGLSYKAAKENNREIIGIYPYVYKEDADKVPCIQIPVKTVNERTNMIIDKSDVLVFLPGGIGTLYELFTSLESKRGSEHKKPIIIYNSCGYFDGLLTYIDKITEDGFVTDSVKNNYCVCNTIDDVIMLLKNLEI